jgi:hypothetical protein
MISLAGREKYLMRTTNIPWFDQKPSARFLDRLYLQPDPCETIGEFERFTHRDLHYMSLEELYREKRRLRYRLDFDDQPTAWMLERLQALLHAITLRRRTLTEKRPFSQAPPKGETLRTVPVEALPPWH